MNVGTDRVASWRKTACVVEGDGGSSSYLKSTLGEKQHRPGFFRQIRPSRSLVGRRCRKPRQPVKNRRRCWRITPFTSFASISGIGVPPSPKRGIGWPATVDESPSADDTDAVSGWLASPFGEGDRRSFAMLVDEQFWRAKPPAGCGSHCGLLYVCLLAH